MENASKALLIAGAILIAILLIAIGMMVFNSASGVIDTAASGMSDHEKTMHNKKFTIYEGTQSGSTVKELIREVLTNNSNEENPKITCFQFLNSKGTYSGTTVGNAEYITPRLNEVVNSAMYDIEVTENSQGIVYRIVISKQGITPTGEPKK